MHLTSSKRRNENGADPQARHRALSAGAYIILSESRLFEKQVTSRQLYITYSTCHFDLFTSEETESREPSIWHLFGPRSGVTGYD